MGNYNLIPKELKQLKQWTCWGKAGEKIKKKPFNPITGNGASSTDSSQWVDFKTAIDGVNRGGYEGIGIFFANGLMGIDLDHVIENNNLSEEAKHIVNIVDSYSEISQSGTGVHILCFGKKPSNEKCKNGKGFEMYDKDRYFALTGDVLAKKYEIKERTNQVEVIYNYYFKPYEEEKEKAIETRSIQSKFIPYDDTIEMMFNSKIGNKIRNLWNGNLTEYENDQSRGDLALCSYLAWFTNGDFQKIDELFQQSGLMREKWNREDYKQRTIAKAIESVGFGFNQDFEESTKKALR